MRWSPAVNDPATAIEAIDNLEAWVDDTLAREFPLI
jgi:uncharacterized membrane protein